MELGNISEVKIAIVSIVALEVVIGLIYLASGTSLPEGVVYSGITAVAGLAGYDMGKKAV